MNLNKVKQNPLTKLLEVNLDVYTLQNLHLGTMRLQNINKGYFK